jgi:hypothetical protein
MIIGHMYNALVKGGEEMSLQMKYFILKPKAKSRDDVFATASQNSMMEYAKAIWDADPKMSEELEAWALREAREQAKMLRR